MMTMAAGEGPCNFSWLNFAFLRLIATSFSKAGLLPSIFDLRAIEIVIFAVQKFLLREIFDEREKASR